MALPIDRGYVILSFEEGRKTTVSVARSRPEQGRSEDVFAVHASLSKLAVHKEVPLVGTGRLAWSTKPVKVYTDDGGLVHVAPDDPVQVAV